MSISRLSFNLNAFKRLSLGWLKSGFPLLSILAFAAMMRLTNLVGPVRGDDFAYLQAANNFFSGSINTNICCGLNRVGIYLPIAIIFEIFGPSFWTSVLFPLISSLGTIVFLFAIGKLLKDETTGLIAALIWAALPLDILYATQLLPDSIAASLTAGAVYFLLLAFQNTGLRRLFLFGLMAFFLSWLFYVKELPLLVSIFCILFIAWQILGKRLGDLYRALSARFSSSALISTGILLLTAFAYIVGSFLFVFPPNGAISEIAKNASDLTQALFLGNAPLEFGESLPRVALFDAVTPLFFLSLFTTLFTERRAALFLISWLAVYLFFAEWGSEITFSSLPILYSHPLPRLVFDRRHILFIFVPITLIIALFLGSGARAQSSRWNLPLLVLISSLIWFAVRERIYAGIEVPLLEAAHAMVLLGLISAPFLQKLKRTRSQELHSLVFLGSLIVASFTPVTRFNALDFQDDRRLMDSYRDVANYLLELESESPIVTIPNNQTRLNYASDFQLGYNWRGSTAYDPEARIIESLENAPVGEPVYIVVEHPGSQFPAAEASPLWTKIEEFGIEGDTWGLTLFKYLPPDLASEIWKEALEDYSLDPSPEKLEDLFLASINAQNLQVAIDLVPKIQRLSPDFDPLPDIQLLARSFIEQFPENSRSLISDLPSLVSNIQTSQGVRSVLVWDQLLLIVDAEEDSRASISLALKPNHVYLLNTRIRSSLPVQVLNLQELGIQDSLNSSLKYLQWTELQAVFITPKYLPNQIANLILFEFPSSSTRNVGGLAIQHLELIELDPVELNRPLDQ